MASKRCLSVLAVLVFSFTPLLAWAQASPSISLEMTLTEDTNDTPGDECGVSDTLVVGAGAEVEVCYTVTNIGDVALNLHDLVDSELGTILSGFAFTLDPAATVWLSQTVIASADTTFNGTWTAFNAGPTDLAEASDSATLTVTPPSITLEMTLTEDTNGTAGDECGVSDTLAAAPGTRVEVCYTVTNTGQTPLDFHDLEDSELGTVLSNFLFTLDPGASVWLSVLTTASNDVTFEGTWTAYNAGPIHVVESSDSAFLTVVYTPVPTLGLPGLILLAGLLGLLAFMYGRTRADHRRGDLK